MSSDPAVARLQQLLRIPTVSRLNAEETDWAQFDAFLSTLQALYPGVHATLQREVVADHSLLLRWPGRAADAPSVLMAHYDVLPADPAGWEHPPFAAEIVGSGDDAVLWARGVLDDKGSLVAILEAVEALLATGFVPAHDLYLSFGHDEETEGTGAAAIVEVLAGRGIRPAFVLDEGGAVVASVFPGVAEDLAMIGVTERGVTSLVLSVDQAGGHASTPPRVTATTRLAQAIVRLHKTPFPARLNRTNRQLINTVGARARQPYRALFTNLWLTAPLITRVFGRLSGETNAMVRTTQAVTMLSGSAAANALAERATATVNIRFAVGTTIADVVAHVRRAIRDDRVGIQVQGEAWEASPLAPTSGPQWELLSATAEAVFPGAIVAPYIQNGTSDSRHFTRVSDAVYRFVPFTMTRAERDTLHAANERMHVASFLRGIEFYRALIGTL